MTRSRTSRKWFPSALRSWRSTAKRKSKRAMAGRSLRCATGGRFASITKRKESVISISTGRPFRWIEMFRLGSATRVLDLLLDTLSQKLNIQSSDPIDVENPMSCLYFDAVLLKSEVFLCLRFDPGSLALSPIRRESFSSRTNVRRSDHLHALSLRSVPFPFGSRLLSTRSRSVFLFFFLFNHSRISQGRTEYALVVLNTALERVNEAQRELGYCASVLELKSCVLRLKYSLLSSFLNTDELESLEKEQRIVNQQRLFLDPSNLQGWYDHFDGCLE